MPFFNGLLTTAVVVGFRQNPPSVPFSLGGQDGNFRRARPAIAIDFPQGREAEKSRNDRSESDLLERGIVPNVGERAGNDVRRPTGSIRARFKAVFLDSAVGVSVLSRQIGEAGNAIRLAHVHGNVCGSFKSSFQRVCQKVDDLPSIALAAELSAPAVSSLSTATTFQPVGGRPAKVFEATMPSWPFGITQAAFTVPVQRQFDRRGVNRRTGGRLGAIHGVNHFAAAGVDDRHPIVGVTIRMAGDWP